MKETCVTTAAAIIKSMDTKSDPCQDFYKYACGRWIKSNPVPDGRSMWGMFNELEMNNQLIVKNALGMAYYFYIRVQELIIFFFYNFDLLVFSI